MIALLIAVVIQGEVSSVLRIREDVYEQVEHGPARRHRAALQALYRSSGYEPVWTHSGRPTRQALAMIPRFRAAQEKGLRPDDYDEGLWTARLRAMDRVRFDLLFSASVIRYVSDLRYGRVNPRMSRLGLGGDDELALGTVAYELSRAEDVEAPLAALEPDFPIYRRTRDALQTYLVLARREGPGVLPISGTNDDPRTYAALPLLIKRLRLVGDLPASAPASEREVAAALCRFQMRHGLPETGRIDRETVRHLSVRFWDRATQLALTLERLRWLPQRFAAPPLVVNIPEFRLHADDDSLHRTLLMGVAVGRAFSHENPVFMGELQWVVFRPYWDVPQDIAVREFLPALERDPSYAEREQLELVDGAGNVVDGADPDVLEQVREGLVRMRQRSGDRNRPGPVKFAFSNGPSVCLHGAPAPDAFERTPRDLGPGCLQVEDPERLAEWVLRGEPEWSREHILAAMSGSRTVRVKLREAIPVLFLYATALVAGNGDVLFFEDIYRQDLALELALSRRAAQGAPNE